MIGFFQNTMAKHHRLMFGLLLVIIVVSFVFYTGSGSAMDLLGMSRSPAICGVKLNSSDVAVYRYGVALRSGGEVSANALAQRIVLVKLAEKYQIPNPTQEEFDAYLKRNFSDSTGTFRPEYITLIMRRYGMNEEMFKSVFVHSIKIDKLFEMFSAAPAMLDSEALLICREIQTEWTIQAARTSLDKFKFDDEPSDEELQKFYDARSANYRIAPLVKLSYAVVKPSAETRAAVGEPQDSELRTFIRARVGANGDVEGEIAANRNKWVAAWKEDRISVETASSVSDMLADVLAQDVVNPELPNFADAVKKSGLEFVEIPAFPRDEIPQNTAVPAEILTSAVASLNSTLWRTDAIPSGENAVVVLFRGDEPARVPELAEVRDKVVADWKAATREEKFSKHADEIGAELKKIVADGKDFVSAASDLGLSVFPVPAFTSQNVPEELQGGGASIIDALKAAPVKSVTDPVRVGDEVVFAYALKKTVPQIDENSENFKMVAGYLGSRRTYAALDVQLSVLISEELAKSRVALPDDE
ncbi:MAG: hypothetical protein LUD39_05985 [Opitutae bacterium]|nr:hypothetical protein [Opitutae bacterium]